MNSANVGYSLHVPGNGKALDAPTLEQARREAGLSLWALWVRYFALGGDTGPAGLGAYLTGGGAPRPYEYDLVAHALNERFWELGRPSAAPYSEER